jgi:hypothetical protein
MKKYGMMKILIVHMHFAWWTPKKQPPLAHTTTHNTQQRNMKHHHHGPPSRRLPAAPILQVSVIAVRSVINHDHCNTAMYFLLATLTFPVFILLLFYVQRLSALTD